MTRTTPRPHGAIASTALVHADIRNIAALQKIAADTEDEFGKVDILVDNAAIQRWKPLLEMEDADRHDVIDNNLNGTANTVRAFAPGMVKPRYGRIILLSSMRDGDDGDGSAEGCRPSMRTKSIDGPRDWNRIQRDAF